MIGAWTVSTLSICLVSQVLGWLTIVACARTASRRQRVGDRLDVIQTHFSIVIEYGTLERHTPWM
jgi:hypothetical protein